MSKQIFNPEALYNGAAFGMSQAVLESESGLVFVSGQVDWNHQHETTETSIEGQTKNALKNLGIALKAAGSSIDQLLQVRIYVRGEVSDYLAEIAPLLVEFFNGSRPAVTGIGVASLASVTTLVEIEAVATTR